MWCAFYIIAHHLPFPSPSTPMYVACACFCPFFHNHASHARNLSYSFLLYILQISILGSCEHLLCIISLIEFGVSTCVCCAAWNIINSSVEILEVSFRSAFRLLQLAQSTGYFQHPRLLNSRPNRVDSPDLQVGKNSWSFNNRRLQVCNESISHVELHTHFVLHFRFRIDRIHQHPVRLVYSRIQPRRFC